MLSKSQHSTARSI